MMVIATALADIGIHDDIGHTAWRARCAACGWDTEGIARAELHSAVAMIDRWRIEWREAGLLSDWPGSRDSCEILGELAGFRSDLVRDQAMLADALHDRATTMSEETVMHLHDAMRHDAEDAL